MSNNGFCPKCGALIHNGACTSCGYGRQANTNTGGRFSSFIGDNVTAGSAQFNAAPKKSNVSWIIAVVFIIIAVFIAITVALVVYLSKFSGSFSSILEEAVVPEPEYQWNNEAQVEQPDDDYEDWIDDDYYYEEYIPNPSDEYYEQIVSSTVRGLSYDIAWTDCYLYPDDEEKYASFSYYYPMIIDSDEAFIADINQAIREKALSYEAVSLEGENYGYVDAYVTYMTEDILSVAFMYNYYAYEKDVEKYIIDAMNFNMKNGELIPIKEIIPDELSAREFRESCQVQNGFQSTTYLEKMTDSDLVTAINDPETGVAFYTPVGIELGFNYPEGWLTVTMKYGTY